MTKSEAERKGADAKGAVEEDVQRITEITGNEALGYTGGASPEHSGQALEQPALSQTEELADNQPDDTKNVDGTPAEHD
ncbi:MAG TPA: hypothetical protein VMT00_01695 [Thermoanaerobaculia bacterium]|nr:hypothetical protein [Thermoanaerobaculia bacterium]